MKWKIAQAKQRFSEVVRRAAEEPQVILNREQTVAVVISPEDLAQFEAWRASRAKRSISEALAEISSICEEEDYVFEAPRRADRANPFLSGGRRASGRHKRDQ